MLEENMINGETSLTTETFLSTQTGPKEATAERQSCLFSACLGGVRLSHVSV